MPSGFLRIIAAQFASALADNALLIVTIAILLEQGRAAWWAPLLKFAFTLAYVGLAPLVGPLADSMPKARLMAWMNGVKMLGPVGLWLGVHPVAAFAVAGLGAAAYAPAKYGLMTELVRPHQLVKANGWIEVSVVGAALLGAVLGGALTTEPMHMASWAAGHLPWSPRTSLAPSLLVLMGLYGVAAGFNLGIPDSGASYPRTAASAPSLLGDFLAANRQLWRDAQGGLSLAVTTLFWGVGATLQFIVLKWAADVLELGLARAASLQAVVAVGVVAGAAAAGRWIDMSRARQVLPVGVGLGLLMPVLASVPNLSIALPLLALAGLLSGILVVPMNALLQHRGHQLLSAGRSVAVQGFNENLSILCLLALYAGLLALQVPIEPIMWVFGLSIAALMATLWRRSRSEGHQPFK